MVKTFADLSKDIDTDRPKLEITEEWVLDDQSPEEVFEQIKVMMREDPDAFFVIDKATAPPEFLRKVIELIESTGAKAVDFPEGVVGSAFPPNSIVVYAGKQEDGTVPDWS